MLGFDSKPSNLSPEPSTTVSPERPPPVLDLAFLSRQTAGDRDLERDVLLLFDRQCLRLPDLVRDGPDAGRADAAHTLVGAARAVGAGEVADRAAALERALAAGVGDPAGELGRALAHAVAAARSAVAARLHDLGSPPDPTP